MAKLVRLILAAAALAGCNGHPDTRLLGIVLWEGDERCASCEASGMVLHDPAVTSVRLRARSTYTVALELRPSGDPKVCIYKFAWVPWRFDALPREFKCLREDRRMTISFPTVRDTLSPPSQHTLHVRVAVMNAAERELRALLFDRTYPVEWIDGVLP